MSLYLRKTKSSKETSAPKSQKKLALQVQGRTRNGNKQHERIR
jgi:hypothetical protein